MAKSVINLPWFIVNRFLAATNKAEDNLGRPPTVFEIFLVFDRHYHHDKIGEVEAMGIVYNLFREDILLADANCAFFTTRASPGFKTFSMLLREKFAGMHGYRCLNDGRIFPTTARTVSLEFLLAMLRSSDASLLIANAWIWEEAGFRFLDGAPISGRRISLNSFPRTGNSFVRRLIEQVTGVATGSLWSIHTGTIL